LKGVSPLVVRSHGFKDGEIVCGSESRFVKDDNRVHLPFKLNDLGVNLILVIDRHTIISSVWRPHHHLRQWRRGCHRCASSGLQQLDTTTPSASGTNPMSSILPSLTLTVYVEHVKTCQDIGGDGEGVRAFKEENATQDEG
jgi:hypothetical protein